MKSQSNFRPAHSFVIEAAGAHKVRICFFEHIVPARLPGGDQGFSWNEYTLVLPDRPGLAGAVESNPGAWLEKAKNEEREGIAEKMRKKRDRRLAASDWTQCVDSPLTPEQRETWKQYRQSLRELPAQPGFPYEVHFPTEPNSGEGKR